MDTYYLFPVWIRNDLAFATPALNKVKGRAIYRGRGRKFTVQGLTFNIGLFHAFGPSILFQATLAELHSRSITTGCCPGASSFRNKLPKQGTWSGANIPLKLCKTWGEGTGCARGQLVSPLCRGRCSPPGLLGGPRGAAVLLFALGSSAFPAASCCDSPFEEKAGRFQWAVTDTPWASPRG